MEVACRQLGFTGGEWYFWHLHLNDTVQMLYEEPGENFLTIIYQWISASPIIDSFGSSMALSHFQ